MDGDTVKLLVVDDEELVCVALKRAFERSEQHAVCTAFAMHEALHKVANHTYDVIITDWSLPDAEGLELLRRVREEGLDIPVIVISSHVRHDILEKASGYNVFRFIGKPFRIEEVRSAVNDALQSRRAS